MNFIELTKYDGPSIIINKTHVSSVMVYGDDYTTIRLSNGQTIEVSEKYDTIKKILTNPMAISIA